MAVTYELDDAKLAASELAERIRESLAPARSSVGFLFCDSEMDHEALLGFLNEELPIDIVGFTTIALIVSGEGFADMAASLAVLTSDDARFSVALSDPLSADDAPEKIMNAYAKARDSLGEDPKLIFAVPPYLPEVILDVYIDALNEASGGVPIFGGAPSNNVDDDQNGILFGGKRCSDRMAVVLFGGDVKPVFNVQNVLGRVTEHKRTVTKSDENIIYRVGDSTFVDFAKQLGLPVENMAFDEDDAPLHFTNPLLVEPPDCCASDGIPVIRALHSVNLEDGSGITLGRVPEGSVISIGVLKGRDIDASAANGASEILAEMSKGENDGYRYSIVFALSCVARYLVLAHRRDAEGRALAESMPEGVGLSGFYSFGELCPTSIKDGQAINRAHNESLILCAL